jgi:hypothetical protein
MDELKQRKEELRRAEEGKSNKTTKTLKRRGKEEAEE